MAMPLMPRRWVCLLIVALVLWSFLPGYAAVDPVRDVSAWNTARTQIAATGATDDVLQFVDLHILGVTGKADAAPVLFATREARAASGAAERFLSGWPAFVQGGIVGRFLYFDAMARDGNINNAQAGMDKLFQETQSPYVAAALAEIMIARGKIRDAIGFLARNMQQGWGDDVYVGTYCEALSVDQSPRETLKNLRFGCDLG